MARTVVSESDLLQWINVELKKCAECTDCTVTSILRLDGVDEVGCNWSSPNLHCSGRPVSGCIERASEVTARARLLFNVEYQ